MLKKVKRVVLLLVTLLLIFSSIAVHAEGSGYIGNKNSKVYHSPECSNLPAQKNRVQFKTAKAAEDAGYRPHKDCVGKSGSKASSPSDGSNKSANAAVTTPKVSSDTSKSASTKGVYIGNVNNHKLHKKTCKNLPAEKNRVYFDSIDEAVNAGYNDYCGNCMK